MVHLGKSKESGILEHRKYGKEAGYQSRKVGRIIITKGIIIIHDWTSFSKCGEENEG